MRRMYYGMVQTALLAYILAFAYIWHIPAVTTHIR